MHESQERSINEHEALGERIAEMAMLIDCATHQLLSDLRQFDASSGWATQGALSCAAWLSWRTGIEPGAAREKVRVARALGELLEMDVALARGELSYAKVRAMTRVATAENQGRLIALARASTAAQLEIACRLFREVHREAGQEKRERRSLRMTETAWGTVRVSVELLPDEAALVVEACRVAAEGGDASSGMVAMAEGVLRGEKRARPPVEVVVHVDAASLTGQTQSGHGVSAEACKRMLCDAGVVPVLEREGKTIDAGRKRRTVPSALRRALANRDRTCRFPSCTHRIVDAHHIVPWWDGGETKLENLALLCRRHHGRIHEGYAMTWEGEALVFRDQAGRVIRPGRKIDDDFDVEVLRRRIPGGRWLRAAYPEWDGEQADYAEMVQAMRG